MQLRGKYLLLAPFFDGTKIIRLLPFFIVLTISGNLFCQSFKEFQNTSNLEEKIVIAYSLGAVYVTRDIDSLKIVGDLLNQSARSFKSKKAENYAKQLLGAYYTRTKEIDKGLSYLRDSRNYFAQNRDLNMVTEVANQIGNAYQFKGKFEKAIQWYHESLLYGYSSSHDKTRNIAKVNLSLAYAELGEYRTAERFATEYRDWAYEIKSKTAIANAYANIGKICWLQRNNDMAIGNFELGMAYAKKSNSIAQLAHAYTNIGITKFIQGNKEESLEYFKNALRLHEKVKTLSSILDAYLNLGAAYNEIGDKEAAELNYKKGLALALNGDKFKNQVEFLDALIELVKSKHIDTKELELEKDKANLNHKEFISQVTKIDQLLDKDLKMKRPDNLVLTNKTKEFYNKLVVPLFFFFVVIILGQLYLKKLV